MGITYRYERDNPYICIMSVDLDLIKDLKTKEANKVGFKLTLNDGRELIGFSPDFSSNSPHFENNILPFLPFEKKDAFLKQFNQPRETNINEMESFLLFLKRDEIKSYEILENNIDEIYSAKGRLLWPQKFKLQIKPFVKPGYVNVKYHIPGKAKWFNAGDVQIKNNSITIPVVIAFVSYAKENKKQIVPIMDKLNDNGVLTWFDESELLPGARWEDKIEEAIKNSDYVLIFFSSDTIKNAGYKNKEIRQALDQLELQPFGKRYIIPILLDDCTPPNELRKIQWLKMWEDSAFEKLLAAVSSS
jgi:hypothetical protein